MNTPLLESFRARAISDARIIETYSHTRQMSHCVFIVLRLVLHRIEQDLPQIDSIINLIITKINSVADFCTTRINSPNERSNRQERKKRDRQTGRYDN